MNKVKKITNLVIDKQSNLDIYELINCLNECQERINKAIEYIEELNKTIPRYWFTKLLEILKGE